MAILEPPDFTLVPYRLLKSKIDTKTDSLCSYLDPKVGARRGPIAAKQKRPLYSRFFPRSLPKESNCELDIIVVIAYYRFLCHT